MNYPVKNMKHRLNILHKIARSHTHLVLPFRFQHKLMYLNHRESDVVCRSSCLRIHFRYIYLIDRWKHYTKDSIQLGEYFPSCTKSKGGCFAGRLQPMTLSFSLSASFIFRSILLMDVTSFRRALCGHGTFLWHFFVAAAQSVACRFRGNQHFSGFGSSFPTNSIHRSAATTGASVAGAGEAHHYHSSRELPQSPRKRDSSANTERNSRGTCVWREATASQQSLNASVDVTTWAARKHLSRTERDRSDGFHGPTEAKESSRW